MIQFIRSFDILILFQLESGLDLAREMIRCYNEGQIEVTEENIGENVAQAFLLI